jgi:hypothetical protein
MTKQWTKEELKKEWIKALRSGEYEQTTSTICNDKEFCCLGVLESIYWGERITWGKFVSHASTSEDGYSLANKFFESNSWLFQNMNDELRFTFNQIADEIEKL